MSIFTKKFFVDVLYWGIPQTKIFFRKIVYAKSFIGFISQYFFKIPKGGVRRLQAASKLLLGGGRNFDPFYFLGGEISKHAACLQCRQWIGDVRFTEINHHGLILGKNMSYFTRILFQLYLGNRFELESDI